jgi:2-polyprenyl-3-methyl-5-hydroxy-6-metoxy-1,4-benzoquinol methylase
VTVLTPVDIATQHTADFVAASVPAGSRLLEVGCGNGQLAAELNRRGFIVTGIDADNECVAQAGKLGVEAFAAEWPATGPDAHRTFDALAFTRSLHHIDALRESIAAAHCCVQPGGQLLLEDFGHDEIGPEVLRWFIGWLHSPRVAALLVPERSKLIPALLSSADALTTWRHYHAHEHRLHTAAAMRDAIDGAFTLRAEMNVPYLYRYLIPVLPVSRDARDVVSDALADEARAAAAGEFVPIGRRIVAVR